MLGSEALAEPRFPPHSKLRGLVWSAGTTTNGRRPRFGCSGCWLFRLLAVPAATSAAPPKKSGVALAGPRFPPHSKFGRSLSSKQGCAPGWLGIQTVPEPAMAAVCAEGRGQGIARARLNMFFCRFDLRKNGRCAILYI